MHAVFLGRFAYYRWPYLRRNEREERSNWMHSAVTPVWKIRWGHKRYKTMTNDKERRRNKRAGAAAPLHGRAESIWMEEKKWKHAPHVATKRRHASSWLPSEKRLTVGGRGGTGFRARLNMVLRTYRLKLPRTSHIVISSQCFPSVCSVKCIITAEFINMNEREQYHLREQSEYGIKYHWQLIYHSHAVQPVREGALL